MIWVYVDFLYSIYESWLILCLQRRMKNILKRRLENFNIYPVIDARVENINKPESEPVNERWLIYGIALFRFLVIG